MEIATREVRMTITMDSNDGCTKTIYIHKNRKPDSIIVKFRYPNGIIDKDRSYDCFLYSKRGESDTEQVINFRNVT